MYFIYLRLLLVVLAFACFGMAFVGCKKKGNQAERDSNYFDSLSESAQYFKDIRTDTCFAYWSNGRGGIITSVECDKVAPLLLNSKPPAEASNASTH